MNTDLIVIGGGVLGTFHAYFARQRGLSVSLLEKNSQPVGATVRNFGQVVPSGMNDRWQQLGRRSLEVYNELQQIDDLSISNNGTIYIASDDDELRLLEELREINRGTGYASELWTADQCLRRYPQLRASYVVGGLFFPEELSVNPRVMIHRLHDLLRQQQVAIETNACVTEIDNTGSRVTCVTTDGRQYSADRVVVCGGSEFGLLYPNLYRDSDIQVVKLQMVLLKSQLPDQLPGNILTGLSIRRYESFEACPSYREIKNREPEDAFWKQWGVHILFKQEADGSIILGDSHQYASVSNPIRWTTTSMTRSCGTLSARVRRFLSCPHGTFSSRGMALTARLVMTEAFSRGLLMTECILQLPSVARG